MGFSCLCGVLKLDVLVVFVITYHVQYDLYDKGHVATLYSMFSSTLNIYFY